MDANALKAQSHHFHPIIILLLSIHCAGVQSQLNKKNTTGSMLTNTEQTTGLFDHRVNDVE